MSLSAAELPRRQRARREGIIEAAAKLLDQRSFDAIQMREVAEAAGVALGTLYRYFASKELLYAAVLEWWSDWDQAPAVEGLTAEERLRSKLLLIVEGVRLRPHFFTMELALQSTADDMVRQLQRAWSMAGRAWLAVDLAVLGRERADLTSEMLWGVVNHVLRNATLHEAGFDSALATTQAFVDLLAGDLARAEAETTTATKK